MKPQLALFMALWVSYICSSLGDEFVTSLSRRALQRQRKVPGCPRGRATYVVSIRDIDGAHNCGGIVIAKNAVLTAASCIDHRIKSVIPAKPIIHIGGYNSDEPYQKRVAAEIFFHEKWNGSQLDGYDLAIVKLDRPTCVLPVKYIGKQNPKQKEFFVFGYGRTYSGGKFSSSNLHGANVTFGSRDYCSSWTKENALKSITCIRASTVGAPTCAGDTGVPTVHAPFSPVYEDSLIAVSSYTVGECGDAESVGVVTSVRYFKKWIKETLKSDAFKASPKGRKKKEDGPSGSGKGSSRKTKGRSTT